MCKARYCGKHNSEVHIDDSPVNGEWVTFPVGARLEFDKSSEVSIRGHSVRRCHKQHLGSSAISCSLFVKVSAAYEKFGGSRMFYVCWTSLYVSGI